MTIIVIDSPSEILSLLPFLLFLLISVCSVCSAGEGEFYNSSPCGCLCMERPRALLPFWLLSGHSSRSQFSLPRIKLQCIHSAPLAVSLRVAWEWSFSSLGADGRGFFGHLCVFPSNMYVVCATCTADACEEFFTWA